jgi:hypothetical protein
MERIPSPDRKKSFSRAIFGMGALVFLFPLASCTPKVDPRKISFMDFVKGDGFSDPIPFNPGTETQYSYDNTRIEMIGGLARLIKTDQLDDDGATTGFSSTDAIGISPYGALNTFPSAQGLKLGLQGGCDGRASDCGGMNSLSPTWTPQYGSLVSYATFDGTLTNLSNGNAVSSRIGPNFTVSGTGASRVNGKIGQAFSAGGTSSLFRSAPISTQTTQVSFGAWVYLAASTASGFVIANGDTASNGYALGIGHGSGGIGGKIT